MLQASDERSAKNLTFLQKISQKSHLPSKESQVCGIHSNRNTALQREKKLIQLMLNNIKDQSTSEEVFKINITCKMTPFTFGFVSCILQ